MLVVAALNPDGHARRLDHSLSFWSRTVVQNGDHAGHDLWASQRASHYGFDLNRQSLLLAHHEARLWVPAWHEWQPHVTGDFHEMGTTSVRSSTYYFSPGDRVRTNHLVPEGARSLLQRMAEARPLGTPVLYVALATWGPVEAPVRRSPAASLAALAHPLDLTAAGVEGIE